MAGNRLEQFHVELLSNSPNWCLSRNGVFSPWPRSCQGLSVESPELFLVTEFIFSENISKTTIFGRTTPV